MNMHFTMVLGNPAFSGGLTVEVEFEYHPEFREADEIFAYVYGQPVYPQVGMPRMDVFEYLSQYWQDEIWEACLAYGIDNEGR